MSRNRAAVRRGFVRAVQSQRPGAPVAAGSVGLAPGSAGEAPPDLDPGARVTRLGGVVNAEAPIELSVTITATATVTIGLENE